MNIERIKQLGELEVAKTTPSRPPVFCIKHNVTMKSINVMGKIYYLCPDCATEMEEKQKQDQLKKDEESKVSDAIRYKQELASKYKDAGVQERFWKETFDTYKISCEGQRKLVDNLKSHVANFANGESFTLLGGVGGGKTHLAQSLIKTLIRGGYSAKYYTAVNLFREAYTYYSSSANISSFEFFQKLKNYDYLVIDEIKEITDNEVKLLFSVLDDRYNACKPTMLITNFIKSELAEQIGAAAADRLVQVNQPIVLTWGSYRAKKKREEIKL